MALNNLNYTGYITIVLEDYIDKSIISNMIEKNIIITFKKYFALNIVLNKYRYCATLDSEIEFVNIHNVFKKFDDFCNRKKIIGSVISTSYRHYDLSHKINEESSLFFKNNEEDYKALIRLTHNFNLYFWFSDISIYDMTYVYDYLNFIGFYNPIEFIHRINWHIFDYIPYVYYIVLYKDYSFINIKEFDINRDWSLESMPIQTYNKVIKNTQYKPLWLIYNTYNENKESIEESDIIVTYHRNDGKYHFCGTD
jgi:hypothetical protein